MATVALAVAGCVLTAPDPASSQRRPTQPVPQQQTPATPAPPAGDAATRPAPKNDDQSRETVQADVSTRQVSVTSSFTGTEIVVFGAVDNSKQPSAESGYYDVVIILEGTPARMVTRKKSNVLGFWVNTQSFSFDLVPSYYAIASSRPFDEIASDDVLKQLEIGFEQIKMLPARGEAERYSLLQQKDFRDAVIRIKQREGLYVQEKYGVVFIGRSLFRASIDLPANVPVGPFDTRVYLFHNGEMLSRYTARLNLEREGLERFLHGFAFGRPFLYGIVTVIIALSAGLAASAVFSRSRH